MLTNTNERRSAADRSALSSIRPGRTRTAPGPSAAVDGMRGRWRLVASPDGADGSTTIGQDARLWASQLAPGSALDYPLAAGRLGYVHVRGMNDESYRDVFSQVLGRDSDKQALIVDTRFNGGGNLHDELATFLSGKRYLEFLPRGQSLG